MQYKMKTKELDDAVDYSIIVLSGMTGLGQGTIQELIDKGVLTPIKDGSVTKINGKQFKDWALSVNDMIEVERTNYPTMKVDE
jgi:hypothetical protein